MAPGAVPLSGQAQRFAAAGLVVVLVAVSVWLFGRSAPPEPTLQVVATAEDWPAGREPGEFVTVELPAAMAGLFVTPDQLVGRVPAAVVPAGSVVSQAMLADPGAGFSTGLASALLAVKVDPSLWPDPGPRPGDAAVLAAEAGGCAAAVLPVIVVDEGSVVVEVRPELAAVLGPETWWIWESPPAGWPACPPAPAEQPDQALVPEQAATSEDEGSSGHADGFG